MSEYVEGTLSKGEKIVVEPKIHWWNYAWPIIKWSFWCLIVHIFSFIFVVNVNGKNIFDVQGLYFVCIAVFIAFMIYECLFARLKEFVCTNKRVVYRRGVLITNVDELQNQKIESIDFGQSLMGRILGYGDIYFSGTGTSKVIFEGIKEPLKIKARITEVIEERE